ncbi:SURF1 family protein [Brucella pseudogrignonensis]|uniref:SURF1-like protein n=1 Tax=Brucella pseudogrignonensis TaxID=419475 RepID=A0ABU1M8A6_9HYPH|nr:SURF1 family protein [Brucella pseudogrignonensis]MDR6432263.1 surfeit locus 1 family protein [Brucella pseudogrignonensis]
MITPMQASSTPQKKKPRFFLGFMAVLGALFFALFLSLGIWQVERLQWKLDLIARVDARVHAEPVAAPGKDDWANVNQADDEYRHVTLTGSYLNDKEVLVRALTERGLGFWVLTPLRSNDGTLTFINRGFIPDAKRDPSSRVETQIAGETTVTGLLRLPEPDGFFLRPNDPARNEWNSRDVKAFAEKEGLGSVAPYFIDADAKSNSGKVPIGGLTVVTFRNNHLSYAITWFALAAMIAGAAVFVWRHENKSKD